MLAKLRKGFALRFAIVQRLENPSSISAHIATATAAVNGRRMKQYSKIEQIGKH